MYGHRARIAYTAPPRIIEIFPYEFYKIVPPGVTLMVSTMAYLRFTREEAEQTFKTSLETAREMGKLGASIVVLGGAGPLEAVLSLDRVQQLIDDTAKEAGVPVTSALTAQMAALNAV